MLRQATIAPSVLKSCPDRMIEALWNGLPPAVRSWRMTRAIGHSIHRRVCRVERSGGCANYTRFFRNLPQLEVLRGLARELPPESPLRIVVLGCSTGAELYSVLWMLRTMRPGQEIRAVGIDISASCIEAAAAGRYDLQATEVAGLSLTPYEGLFSREGESLRIQDWLRKGIEWCVGDVCSTDLLTRFGLQDIVLANNFLFHMSPQRAEACLRNIGRLLAPNRFLFVSGADLDVRSRAIQSLGFIPVTVRLEDIYTAEEGMLTAWPLRFWGLEPIDRNRADWLLRYSTVFKAPGGVAHAPQMPETAAMRREA